MRGYVSTTFRRHSAGLTWTMGRTPRPRYSARGAFSQQGRRLTAQLPPTHQHRRGDGRFAAACVISYDVNGDIEQEQEVLVTRTLVDIDDDALAAAAGELGTSTKVETVNRALAEIAARPRRLAALERLRTAEDDLGDPDVMRGAWR